MDHTIAIPILIAFFATVLLGPMTIRYLHRLKFGQYIREEGPQSHQKKSGTPTMGGLLFLLGMLVGCAWFIPSSHRIIAIILVTLGFSAIGFIDDFTKVVMKRNLGLTPLQKILGQVLVAVAFCIYMVRFSGYGTEVLIPFGGGSTIDLGILYVPLLVFVLVGTVNGSNFTDGLDGLASSVTAVIAVFLTAVSVTFGAGIHPVTGAMLGGLLGFLWFNTYPAKIFMGDTGSLAIGGFVASSAYLLRMPLFIPIFAFIYLLEVMSVIIQVAYFKRTRKRVFKMAPIHHHFELSGWPETKVVSIFTVVTAILCVIAMLAL